MKIALIVIAVLQSVPCDMYDAEKQYTTEPTGQAPCVSQDYAHNRTI